MPYILLCVVLLALPLAAGAQTSRADWYRHSLVNVHCDNHSGLLGKGVPPADLAAMLQQMPITMIQVSAQSNGYATYPTQVNLNNPGADGYDTLAAFKTATQAQGKKLCIYMSVDRRPLQFKVRPEWFARNADGSPQINGEECVCQRPNREHKGYLYECFLPQIREIIRLYDPDGFWFDGDYILTKPCWCANCLKEWQADTGKPAPRDNTSPDWPQWVDWHLTRYREYRRLVAEAIHQASPKALYTSNWSWAWTPEPVPDYADTLSGDTWSVGQTHFVVQRWGAQDTPWDMMSYCVPGSRNLNRTYSLQRTLQEGALALAHGGNWFLWSFAGDVPPVGVDETRSLANWARDREAAVGPSESLSPVAVLDSETSWAAGGEAGMNSRAHGLARALAESHYLTDLVNEKTLAAHWQRYRVLLVPEHRVVAPETLALLQRFAEQGGTVLLTGAALRGADDQPDAAAKLLGLQRTAPADQHPARLKFGADDFYLVGAWGVTPQSAKVVVSFADGQPALLRNAVGQGTVAYLAASGGLGYPDDGLTALVLRALALGPSYEVGGGAANAAVLCTLRGKPGETVLHVCDLSARVSGQWADIDTRAYTDLNPPLGGVRVTLPLAEAPAAVKAVPAGTLVGSQYADGRLTLTLSNLQTHAAVILTGNTPKPLGLLPATTPATPSHFHPPADEAGIVVNDDFEKTAVGAGPGSPWAAENRGATRIFVTDETAASGRHSLCFVDTADSSFWPFLHCNVPTFRRGRARLSFDLRLEPGAVFYTEARYEGKGAGPSISVDGTGRLNVTDKVTLPPNQWHHWDIAFVLGNDKPGYTLRLTPQGKETVTLPDLPYATDWFYLCNSLYFVGNGNAPANFYLDNVVFERLGLE